MDCSCPCRRPELHLIPGYMGYVPHMKLKFGSSYGKEAGRNICDPCVDCTPPQVPKHISVLEQLNPKLMARTPENIMSGLMEELGEFPIITLHKLQQRKEDSSGKFYADDRGLAEVCNPVGVGYMTARPFRCHPIYRYCEPVKGNYAGYVPGEQFMVGMNRGKSTRNALKHLTWRV